MRSKTFKIQYENDTALIARQLANDLWPGCCVYLSGPLGSGKTTFVREMLRNLGYEDKVKSPTYTLVEAYSIHQLDIYHFDLYRITHPETLFNFGLSDYFTGQSLCFIEWPELGKGVIPQADITCDLFFSSGIRKITVTQK